MPAKVWVRLRCTLLHWPFWRVVSVTSAEPGVETRVTECRRCGDRWAYTRVVG